MVSLRKLRLIGIGTFLLINVPSLKLLLGNTPAVNLAATGVLLWGAAALVFLQRRIRLNRHGWALFGGLMVTFVLMVLPEFLFLRASNPGFAYDATKFLYGIACVAPIVATATTEDVRAFVMLQIGWGLLVAVFVLAGIIEWTQLEALHYNTVSLPIALSVLVVFCNFIEKRWHTWTSKAAGAGILLVEGIALAHLPGRAPFIFIPLILIGLSLIKPRGWRRSLKPLAKAVAAGGALIVLAVVAANYYGIGFTAFDRITYAYEAGSNARIGIYQEALGFIAERPLGHGFGAYERLSSLAPYPHNFLLEAAVVGGVFVAVLLGLIFIIFGLWMLRAYQAQSDPAVLRILSITLYVILTFSVSYSLVHMYVVFPLLALATTFPSKASVPVVPVSVSLRRKYPHKSGIGTGGRSRN